MARILLAQFDDFASAEAAAVELKSLAVDEHDIEIFALNAPGQHDRFPIGGDQDEDRGARKGDEGAVSGAAIGSAAGVALGAVVTPLVGPLGVAAGAAIGAYTGSLAGAVNRMGEDAPAVEIPPRPAGVRLAVHVSPDVTESDVVAAFRRHDVRSIEEGEGTWSDGWSDFDPVSTPHWIEAPTQHLAP